MATCEPPGDKRRWVAISFRLIRTVVFAVCVVACVAFAALWARSHYWNDTIYRHQSELYWHLRSWKGSLQYYSRTWDGSRDPFIGLNSNPTEEYQSMLSRHGSRGITGPELWGFGWGERAERTRVVAPHWFVALMAIAIAFAVKPKPRWRFSVGELLAIMTATAVAAPALSSLHQALVRN